MNPTKTFVVLLSLVGLLLAPASFAAQHEGVKGMQEEGLQVHRARLFIGSNVENSQGESLGKIDDLVINPADGQIIYAALSYGSILGLGGKLFAVPWEALQLQSDGKTFALNIVKEELENAPGFDKGTWPQQPDPMLSVAMQGTAESTMPPQARGVEPPSASKAGAQSDETISATVQGVDAQQETVTLRTSDGETVDLRAPAELLAGLQSGDAVEVAMVGKEVRAIHKKEDGAQQTPPDAQKPQPAAPGGMPKPQ
jgi:sporulation protein YlmC with PRC-barrel domain/Cu/Ag efflux protein CusF